jgi:hypothetical protein
MPSRISEAGGRTGLLSEGSAGVGRATEEAEVVRIKRGKADE